MHETNCQICEGVQLLFCKALHLVVAHDPNLQAIYYFSDIFKKSNGTQKGRKLYPKFKLVNIMEIGGCLFQ
jgi:hypothetical protein